MKSPMANAEAAVEAFRTQLIPAVGSHTSLEKVQSSSMLFDLTMSALLIKIEAYLDILIRMAGYKEG